MEEKKPEREEEMDAESAEMLSRVIGRLLDGYYQTEPSRQTDQDAEPRPGTACP